MCDMAPMSLHSVKQALWHILHLFRRAHIITGFIGVHKFGPKKP